jgi:hypothetical protein
MKIRQYHFNRPVRQNGSIVIVFLTLLAIMMILVAANSSALTRLHRETKLLEHRQIERLNASQTNTVADVALPAKPESK